MKTCAANTAHKPGGATVSSWGMNERNHRFVDASVAGITPQNVADLRLAWVFDFPGATRARSQPTVDGDTVYVGSQSGAVYAIDLHSGCLRWSFQADTEVRAAVSIEHGAAGTPAVLYAGDTDGNLYALNAQDGSQRWRSSLVDHKDVTITGSPKLFEGRLYVPMSSREWAVAAD
ncbi:MAG: PQQ-binding-like beta-propeller repeat protein, partial [Gammaproteobacteria bacterium]